MREVEGEAKERELDGVGLEGGGGEGGGGDDNNAGKE